MDNYTIADQFSLLARLMDIHGENSFKSRSYANAAFQLEKLPAQISSLPRHQIKDIKGIGEAIAQKILELMDTGRLPLLEQYIAATPKGILEIMQIKGLGPKKIHTIWKEMGIETIGELLYACEENRLLLYKGFGEKTQQNVRDAIQFFLRHQGSFLYADIEPFVKQVDQTIRQEFPQAHLEVTGEYRRQMEVLTRVEWVYSEPLPALESWLKSQAFDIAEVSTDRLVAQAEQQPPLVFHYSPKAHFGNKLLLTTGPENFTAALSSRSPIPETEDERLIFESCSLPWILPCRRDLVDPDQPQLWRNEVIQVSDIRGIIHSHSTWSDGTHSLREMAEAARDGGFEYLVISDHSKIAFYANGLSEERIIAQHREIDELNRELAPFRIFKSIEADILNDGQLDYTDEVLKTFDLVIASVHSNLKMTEEKATARLLAAIENPYTTILGHMTGRLLLSRAGYPIDHRKVIDACVERGVVIELNAHPRRLDIDWRWIDYALAKGALISIDPDAHAIEGFNDIRYGVLAAQKAGVTAKENLSSFTREQFRQFLQQKRG